MSTHDLPRTGDNVEIRIPATVRVVDDSDSGAWLTVELDASLINVRHDGRVTTSVTVADLLPPATSGPSLASVHVGATLYGYCGGMFGDFYDDKTVEAVGHDWCVVRESENEQVLHTARSDGGDIREHLVTYTVRQEDYEP